MQTNKGYNTLVAATEVLEITAKLGVTSSFKEQEEWKSRDTIRADIEKFLANGRHDVYYFNRTETLLRFFEMVLSAAPQLYRRYENAFMMPNVMGELSQQVISHRGLEFLEDTLLYLKTGERATHLETWINIIHDDGNYLSYKDYIAKYNLVKNGFAELFDFRKESSIDKCISMWCSKERGLRDLVYTLYFFLISTFR